MSAHDEQTQIPVVLTMEQEADALREMAQKIQQMCPSGQRASIFWLADFFLGIKLWRQW